MKKYANYLKMMIATTAVWLPLMLLFLRSYMRNGHKGFLVALIVGACGMIVMIVGIVLEWRRIKKERTIAQREGEEHQQPQLNSIDDDFDD